MKGKKRAEIDDLKSGKKTTDAAGEKLTRKDIAPIAVVTRCNRSQRPPLNMCGDFFADRVQNRRQNV